MLTRRIDADRRRITTQASGVVTYAELTRHLDDEEGDGSLGFEELLDARGASTDLRRQQVRELVARTDALVRNGRFGALAIVTDNDLTFGMARMYQILCDPLPVRIGVFRTLDDATAWLDGRGDDPP